MTKSIDEMAVQELHIEIAKELGYTAELVKFDKNCTPIDETDYYELRLNGDSCDDSVWLTQDDCLIQATPDFTGDIAAAWELVEEMKNNKCYVYLNYHPTPKWECKIKDTDSFDYGWHKGTADTAPIAICRAWLKWKENSDG